MPVSGTDGLQFQPNLQEEDTLNVFNADLQRTLNYSFKESNEDTYKGLDVLIYYSDFSQFLNMTAQPSNSVYNVYIDGTQNITTITNSPAFASKGNFYQISA